MTSETSSERDNSLDDTLAAFFISGEYKKTKNIFPRRIDRLQFYGRIIAPVLRHPLRSMFTGFNDVKGEQVVAKGTRDLTEWALEGDRCAPEHRQNLEVALLIDSAFENPPET